MFILLVPGDNFSEFFLSPDDKNFNVILRRRSPMPTSLPSTSTTFLSFKLAFLRASIEVTFLTSRSDDEKAGFNNVNNVHRTSSAARGKLLESFN